MLYPAEVSKVRSLGVLFIIPLYTKCRPSFSIIGASRRIKDSFVLNVSLTVRWIPIQDFNNEIMSIFHGPLSWLAGLGCLNSILSPNNCASSYATDIFWETPPADLRFFTVTKQSCNCALLFILQESIPWLNSKFNVSKVEFVRTIEALAILSYKIP